MKIGAFIIVCCFMLANILLLLAGNVHASPLYSKPQSLSHLIVELVEQNDELRSFRKELDALKEEVEVAGALDDPRLGVGVANLPIDSPSFNEDPMTQKQLFISQKFPWFGKLDLRTQRSAIAVERQKAIIHVRTQILIESLSLAYFDLGLTLEELRYNAELTQMVKQMLLVAEAVYASGRGLQQDVLQGQVELSKLISEKINIEKRNRVLITRINELLNRDSTPAVAPVKGLDFLNKKIDPNEMYDLALNNNPRLWVQQTEIDKATINIELAHKGYYPDMDFRVGYGQRDDGGTGDDLDDFVSASVVVTIPLYQHRKQDRQLEAAIHRLKSAKKAYKNLAQTLPHQVDAIIEEINSIRQNYSLFKEGLVQQTDLWSRSSLAAYEVGKLDFDTMINAHVRRVRFELQAEKFRYQIFQKYAQLEAVTGTALFDLPINIKSDENDTNREKDKKTAAVKITATSKAGAYQ